MAVYRVLFIRNEVSDMHVVKEPPVFSGDYMYYAHAGRLVYAYVMAENRMQAAGLCREIIREVAKKDAGVQPSAGLPE